MTRFELVCRSTLELSMTSKDHFKTKLSSTALSFKRFSYNCIFEINLLAKKINSLKVILGNIKIMAQRNNKSNTVVSVINTK